MLPLENIFDIARDELKNNADEYVLDTNVKYYTLKLAYIRVNNRTDMQKYSYIPVSYTHLCISHKHAVEKAYQEYDIFNKTQPSESDVDKIVKGLEKKI